MVLEGMNTTAVTVDVALVVHQSVAIAGPTYVKDQSV
jgi:hypothetical protein